MPTCAYIVGIFHLPFPERDRLTKARMLAFKPINTSIKQNHKSGKGTNDTPVDRYFFFIGNDTEIYR